MRINNLKLYRERAKKVQTDILEVINRDQGTNRTIQNYSHYEIHRQPKLDICRAIVKYLNKQGVKCDLDKVFPRKLERDYRSKQ